MSAYLAPAEYDLLDLLADEHTVPGHDAVDLFLDACRRDAAAHSGFVSVVRVRRLLADAQIPPARLSAMWSHWTGAGKPMRRADGFDANDGETTRNGNKVYPRRRWVGIERRSTT